MNSGKEDAKRLSKKIKAKLQNESKSQRLLRIQKALEATKTRRTRRKLIQQRPKFHVEPMVPKNAAKYGAWTQEFNVNQDKKGKKEEINFMNIKKEKKKIIKCIIDKTKKNKT